MTTVDSILDLFRQRGDSEYGGELVTQQEHALQAAWLAEQEQAPPALIAAALLHDLGHILHDLPPDAPDQGIDDRHEISAGNYLQKLFPPEVTEPIRLHVAAKRFLAADESYYRLVSIPSQTSLQLQGGPMSAAERQQFAAGPHAEAALRVRRWDDLAKVPGLDTPPLAHFAACLQRVALRQTRDGAQP